MSTHTKEDKKKTRRVYRKPDFLTSIVFERTSLACVPTNLNTQPGPAPFGCSMQS